MRISGYVSILSLVLLSSCLNNRSQKQVCEVAEYFITERNASLNIDSVAIWQGPAEEHWLIATAKTGHILPVFSAITGAFIKEIGKPGIAQGELQRPNGIAVADNLLFVIERDNKRMQIFSLPEGNSLALTEGIMERPYGLAVMHAGGAEYRVYITDNYNATEKNGPKRVHEYRVHAEDLQASITFVRSFGDTQGAGALYKVESIAVDPMYDRLIIADEYGAEKNIKIYTLDGVFTGQVIGSGLIDYEPEGIGIYPTGPKSGYVIVTDQDRVGNKFYVFDRETLADVASFKGRVVRNTDGIAVTDKSFGPFKSGAFYAVHDDGNICAYDWHTIAAKCGLQEHI